MFGILEVGLGFEASLGSGFLGLTARAWEVFAGGLLLSEFVSLKACLVCN